MIPHFEAFACIDWSGAQGERLKGLAVAVAEAGDGAPEPVDPPRGRHWSRADVLAWIQGQAARPMLIGLDLSCALPFADGGAFLPGVEAATAPDLWAYVETLSGDDPHHQATRFIEAHAAHFRLRGRQGALFGANNGRLRVTERKARALGVNPCSSFNLVGPAQVGRSSLTGMRVLHALAGRIPVWPFHAVGASRAAIVEIYTSIAARAAGVRGGAKLRTIPALNAALAHPAIASRPIAGQGTIDDHRSDALLTAAWLRRASGKAGLWHPEGIEPVRMTEGWTFGVP